jgi:hypothetical protein
MKKTICAETPSSGDSLDELTSARRMTCALAGRTASNPFLDITEFRTYRAYNNVI